jgi:hypothetical protein
MLVFRVAYTGPFFSGVSAAKPRDILMNIAVIIPSLFNIGSSLLYSAGNGFVDEFQVHIFAVWKIVALS